MSSSVLPIGFASTVASPEIWFNGFDKKKRFAARVLANNVGYFKTHRGHMDYPAYRQKGWPIGSGVTESAVKLFYKRVKGTEQFWSIPGVESILSLRTLWLSQDDR